MNKCKIIGSSSIQKLMETIINENFNDTISICTDDIDFYITIADMYTLTDRDALISSLNCFIEKHLNILMLCPSNVQMNTISDVYTFENRKYGKVYHVTGFNCCIYSKNFNLDKTMKSNCNVKTYVSDIKDICLFTPFRVINPRNYTDYENNNMHHNTTSALDSDIVIVMVTSITILTLLYTLNIITHNDGKSF